MNGGLGPADWRAELDVARTAARRAGRLIEPEFGRRAITKRKGQRDVQLAADLISQRSLADDLLSAYPTSGFVAEEDDVRSWVTEGRTWVVDPLDGTNNFGFGIAHCAISIAMFHDDSLVLALTYDPLLKREFSEVTGSPRARTATDAVDLSRATVSVATNYTETGRLTAEAIGERLGPQCKRVLTMWSPALDLALVASGAIDAVIGYEMELLDTCGGVFLVRQAGGCVVDFEGHQPAIRGSCFGRPVSFVAARNQDLAREILHVTAASSLVPAGSGAFFH